MSIYVIGDIHGCYDTFMALLKKLPDDAKICLCGDLIDRGPKSKEVVQYVIDNKIDCVMGNHEEMMTMSGLRVTTNPNGNYMLNDDIWTLNGGRQTLLSYYDEDQPFNLEVFREHRDFMENLPVYIEYKDIKNEDGRHLVVSHSIIHNVWKFKDVKKESHAWNEFTKTALWGRSFAVKDNPEIYNIIGHTPQEYNARITKIYANVDTGCCFKEIPSRLDIAPYGTLTAISYPEMELITQINVDKY